VAILEALVDGPADAHTLAERIYTDTPAALMPAAARNTLAHLIDLKQKSLVTSHDLLSPHSRFARTAGPVANP